MNYLLHLKQLVRLVCILTVIQHAVGKQNLNTTKHNDIKNKPKRINKTRFSSKELKFNSKLFVPKKSQTIQKDNVKEKTNVPKNTIFSPEFFTDVFNLKHHKVKDVNASRRDILLLPQSADLNVLGSQSTQILQNQLYQSENQYIPKAALNLVGSRREPQADYIDDSLISKNPDEQSYAVLPPTRTFPDTAFQTPQAQEPLVQSSSKTIYEDSVPSELYKMQGLQETEESLVGKLLSHTPTGTSNQAPPDTAQEIISKQQQQFQNQFHPKPPSSETLTKPISDAELLVSHGFGSSQQQPQSMLKPGLEPTVAQDIPEVNPGFHHAVDNILIDKMLNQPHPEQNATCDPEMLQMMANCSKSEDPLCYDNDIDAFRRNGLQQHKKLRSIHASPILELNELLNNEAQDYSEKLADAPKLAYSDPKERPGQGENIAVRCSDDNSKLTAKEAVNYWYNKVCKDDFDFNQYSPEMSQFAQVIWKDTNYVGLGRTTRPKGNLLCTYIVARYSPQATKNGFMENVPRGRFNENHFCTRKCQVPNGKYPENQHTDEHVFLGSHANNNIEPAVMTHEPHHDLSPMNDQHGVNNLLSPTPQQNNEGPLPNRDHVNSNQQVGDNTVEPYLPHENSFQENDNFDSNVNNFLPTHKAKVVEVPMVIKPSINSHVIVPGSLNVNLKKPVLHENAKSRQVKDTKETKFIPPELKKASEPPLIRHETEYQTHVLDDLDHEVVRSRKIQQQTDTSKKEDLHLRHKLNGHTIEKEYSNILNSLNNESEECPNGNCTKKHYSPEQLSDHTKGLDFMSRFMGNRKIHSSNNFEKASKYFQEDDDKHRAASRDHERNDESETRVSESKPYHAARYSGDTDSHRGAEVSSMHSDERIPDAKHARLTSNKEKYQLNEKEIDENEKLKPQVKASSESVLKKLKNTDKDEDDRNEEKENEEKNKNEPDHDEMMLRHREDDDDGKNQVESEPTTTSGKILKKFSNKDHEGETVKDTTTQELDKKIETLDFSKNKKDSSVQTTEEKLQSDQELKERQDERIEDLKAKQNLGEGGKETKVVHIKKANSNTLVNGKTSEDVETSQLKAAAQKQEKAEPSSTETKAEPSSTETTTKSEKQPEKASEEKTKPVTPVEQSATKTQPSDAKTTPVNPQPAKQDNSHETGDAKTDLAKTSEETATKPEIMVFINSTDKDVHKITAKMAEIKQNETIANTANNNTTVKSNTQEEQTSITNDNTTITENSTNTPNTDTSSETSATKSDDSTATPVVSPTDIDTATAINNIATGSTEVASDTSTITMERGDLSDITSTKDVANILNQDSSVDQTESTTSKKLDSRDRAMNDLTFLEKESQKTGATRQMLQHFFNDIKKSDESIGGAFYIQLIPAKDLNDFRRDITSEHNRYRKIHGVPPLMVDNTLSHEAQLYAAYAAKHGTVEHSDPHERPDVGESVAEMCTKEGVLPTAEHVVNKWYSEICNPGFDFTKDDKQPGTGHFTQIIWKDTGKLGVGLAVANHPNGDSCSYVVARYKNAGNYLDKFKDNIQEGNFARSNCNSNTVNNIDTIDTSTEDETGTKRAHILPKRFRVHKERVDEPFITSGKEYNKALYEKKSTEHYSQQSLHKRLSRINPLILDDIIHKKINKNENKLTNNSVKQTPSTSSPGVIQTFTKNINNKTSPKAASSSPSSSSTLGSVQTFNRNTKPSRKATACSGPDKCNKLDGKKAKPAAESKKDVNNKNNTAKPVVGKNNKADQRPNQQQNNTVKPKGKQEENKGKTDTQKNPATPMDNNRKGKNTAKPFNSNQKQLNHGKNVPILNHLNSPSSSLHDVSFLVHNTVVESGDATTRYIVPELLQNNNEGKTKIHKYNQAKIKNDVYDKGLVSGTLRQKRTFDEELLDKEDTVAKRSKISKHKKKFHIKKSHTAKHSEDDDIIDIATKHNVIEDEQDIMSLEKNITGMIDEISALDKTSEKNNTVIQALGNGTMSSKENNTVLNSTVLHPTNALKSQNTSSSHSTPSSIHTGVKRSSLSSNPKKKNVKLVKSKSLGKVESKSLSKAEVEKEVNKLITGDLTNTAHQKHEKKREHRINKLLTDETTNTAQHGQYLSAADKHEKKREHKIPVKKSTKTIKSNATSTNKKLHDNKKVTKKQNNNTVTQKSPIILSEFHHEVKRKEKNTGSKKNDLEEYLKNIVVKLHNFDKQTDKKNKDKFAKEIKKFAELNEKAIQSKTQIKHHLNKQSNIPNPQRKLEHFVEAMGKRRTFESALDNSVATTMEQYTKGLSRTNDVLNPKRLINLNSMLKSEDILDQPSPSEMESLNGFYNKDLIQADNEISNISPMTKILENFEPAGKNFEPAGKTALRNEVENDQSKVVETDDTDELRHDDSAKLAEETSVSVENSLLADQDDVKTDASVDAVKSALTHSTNQNLDVSPDEIQAINHEAQIVGDHITNAIFDHDTENHPTFLKENKPKVTTKSINTQHTKSLDEMNNWAAEAKKIKEFTGPDKELLDEAKIADMNALETATSDAHSSPLLGMGNKGELKPNHKQNPMLSEAEQLIEDHMEHQPIGIEMDVPYGLQEKHKQPTNHKEIDQEFSKERGREEDESSESNDKETKDNGGNQMTKTKSKNNKDEAEKGKSERLTEKEKESAKERNKEKEKQVLKDIGVYFKTQGNNNDEEENKVGNDEEKMTKGENEKESEKASEELSEKEEEKERKKVEKVKKLRKETDRESENENERGGKNKEKEEKSKSNEKEMNEKSSYKTDEKEKEDKEKVDSNTEDYKSEKMKEKLEKLKKLKEKSSYKSEEKEKEDNEKMINNNTQNEDDEKNKEKLKKIKKIKEKEDTTKMKENEKNEKELEKGRKEEHAEKNVDDEVENEKAGNKQQEKNEKTQHFKESEEQQETEEKQPLKALKNENKMSENNIEENSKESKNKNKEAPLKFKKIKNNETSKEDKESSGKEKEERLSSPLKFKKVDSDENHSEKQPLPAKIKKLPENEEEKGQSDNGNDENLEPIKVKKPIKPSNKKPVTEVLSNHMNEMLHQGQEPLLNKPLGSQPTMEGQSDALTDPAYQNADQEHLGERPSNPSDVQQSSLMAHNKLRKIHHAPSLELSKQLSDEAQLYAETLVHKYKGMLVDSPFESRLDQGENLAINCDPNNQEMTGEEASYKWYAEICEHGYDFNHPQITQGTEKFSQLIWKGSRYFGIGKMTTKRNGMTCTIIVARYQPKGNTPNHFQFNIDEGDFDASVCDGLSTKALETTSQFPMVQTLTVVKPVEMPQLQHTQSRPSLQDELMVNQPGTKYLNKNQHNPNPDLEESALNHYSNPPTTANSHKLKPQNGLHHMGHPNIKNFHHTALEETDQHSVEMGGDETMNFSDDQDKPQNTEDEEKQQKYKEKYPGLTGSLSEDSEHEEEKPEPEPETKLKHLHPEKHVQQKTKDTKKGLASILTSHGAYKINTDHHPRLLQEHGDGESLPDPNEGEPTQSISVTDHHGPGHETSEPPYHIFPHQTHITHHSIEEVTELPSVGERLAHAVTDYPQHVIINHAKQMFNHHNPINNHLPLAEPPNSRLDATPEKILPQNQEEPPNEPLPTHEEPLPTQEEPISNQEEPLSNTEEPVANHVQRHQEQDEPDQKPSGDINIIHHVTNILHNMQKTEHHHHDGDKTQLGDNVKLRVGNNPLMHEGREELQRTEHEKEAEENEGDKAISHVQGEPPLEEEKEESESDHHKPPIQENPKFNQKKPHKPVAVQPEETSEHVKPPKNIHKPIVPIKKPTTSTAKPVADYDHKEPEETNYKPGHEGEEEKPLVNPQHEQNDHNIENQDGPNLEEEHPIENQHKPHMKPTHFPGPVKAVKPIHSSKPTSRPVIHDKPIVTPITEHNTGTAVVDGIGSIPSFGFASFGSPVILHLGATGFFEDPASFLRIGLSTHNKVRKIHGSPAMTIDPMLTMQAYQHAVELSNMGYLKHQEIDMLMGQGENLFMGCYDGEYDISAEEAVLRWYAEVCHPGYCFNQSTTCSGTGHFSQVVWATSIKLGMAKATRMQNGLRCTYIVARYFPGGNENQGYSENVKTGNFDDKKTCRDVFESLVEFEKRNEMKVAMEKQERDYAREEFLANLRKTEHQIIEQMHREQGQEKKPCTHHAGNEAHPINHVHCTDHRQDNTVHGHHGNENLGQPEVGSNSENPVVEVNINQEKDDHEDEPGHHVSSHSVNENQINTDVAGNNTPEKLDHDTPLHQDTNHETTAVDHTPNKSSYKQWEHQLETQDQQQQGQGESLSNPASTDTANEEQELLTKELDKWSAAVKNHTSLSLGTNEEHVHRMMMEMARESPHNTDGAMKLLLGIKVKPGLHQDHHLIEQFAEEKMKEQMKEKLMEQRPGFHHQTEDQDEHPDLQLEGQQGKIKEKMIEQEKRKEKMTEQEKLKEKMMEQEKIKEKMIEQQQKQNQQLSHSDVHYVSNAQPTTMEQDEKQQQQNTDFEPQILHSFLNKIENMKSEREKEKEESKNEKNLSGGEMNAALQLLSKNTESNRTSQEDEVKISNTEDENKKGLIQLNDNEVRVEIDDDAQSRTHVARNEKFEKEKERHENSNRHSDIVIHVDKSSKEPRITVENTKEGKTRSKDSKEKSKSAKQKSKHQKVKINSNETKEMSKDSKMKPSNESKADAMKTLKNDTIKEIGNHTSAKITEDHKGREPLSKLTTDEKHEGVSPGEHLSKFSNHSSEEMSENLADGIEREHMVDIQQTPPANPVSPDPPTSVSHVSHAEEINMKPSAVNPEQPEMSHKLHVTELKMTPHVESLRGPQAEHHQIHYDENNEAQATLEAFHKEQEHAMPNEHDEGNLLHHKFGKQQVGHGDDTLSRQELNEQQHRAPLQAVGHDAVDLTAPQNPFGADQGDLQHPVHIGLDATPIHVNEGDHNNPLLLSDHFSHVTHMAGQNQPLHMETADVTDHVSHETRLGLEMRLGTEEQSIEGTLHHESHQEQQGADITQHHIHASHMLSKSDDGSHVSVDHETRISSRLHQPTAKEMLHQTANEHDTETTPYNVLSEGESFHNNPPPEHENNSPPKLPEQTGEARQDPQLLENNAENTSPWQQHDAEHEEHTTTGMPDNVEHQSDSSHVLTQAEKNGGVTQQQHHHESHGVVTIHPTSSASNPGGVIQSTSQLTHVTSDENAPMRVSCEHDGGEHAPCDERSMKPISFEGPATGDVSLFQLASLQSTNTYRQTHMVPALKLNQDMSREATEYAKRIAKLGTLRHSGTEDGENIASVCREKNVLMTGEEAATIWYREVCDPGYDFITGQPGKAGHFTQVIWKGSQEFGIGRAAEMHNGLLCTYIVARYRPAGNFIGEFAENVPRGHFNSQQCVNLARRNELIPNPKNLFKRSGIPKFANLDKTDEAILRYRNETNIIMKRKKRNIVRVKEMSKNKHSKKVIHQRHTAHREKTKKKLIKNKNKQSEKNIKLKVKSHDLKLDNIHFSNNTTKPVHSIQKFKKKKSLPLSHTVGIHKPLMTLKSKEAKKISASTKLKGRRNTAQRSTNPNKMSYKKKLKKTTKAQKKDETPHHVIVPISNLDHFIELKADSSKHTSLLTNNTEPQNNNVANISSEELLSTSPKPSTLLESNNDKRHLELGKLDFDLLSLSNLNGKSDSESPETILANELKDDNPDSVSQDLSSLIKQKLHAKDAILSDESQMTNIIQEAPENLGESKSAVNVNVVADDTFKHSAQTNLFPSSQKLNMMKNTTEEESDDSSHPQNTGGSLVISTLKNMRSNNSKSNVESVGNEFHVQPRNNEQNKLFENIDQLKSQSFQDPDHTVKIKFIDKSGIITPLSSVAQAIKCQQHPTLTECKPALPVKDTIQSSSNAFIEKPKIMKKPKFLNQTVNHTTHTTWLPQLHQNPASLAVAQKIGQDLFQGSHEENENKGMLAMSTVAEQANLPPDLLLGDSGMKTTSDILKMAKIGSIALQLAKKKALQNKIMQSIQASHLQGVQLLQKLQEKNENTATSPPETPKQIMKNFASTSTSLSPLSLLPQTSLEGTSIGLLESFSGKDCETQGNCITKNTLTNPTNDDQTQDVLNKQLATSLPNQMNASQQAQNLTTNIVASPSAQTPITSNQNSSLLIKTESLSPTSASMNDKPGSSLADKSNLTSVTAQPQNSVTLPSVQTTSVLAPPEAINIPINSAPPADQTASVAENQLDSPDTEFEKATLNAHNSFRMVHEAKALSLDEKLTGEAKERARQLAALGQQDGGPAVGSDEGENVAMICKDLMKREMMTGPDAVLKWYDQVCIPPEYVFDVERPQKNADQFQQLVWKETSKLGVGRSTFEKNGRFCTVIVARYSPGRIANNARSNVIQGSFEYNSYCNGLGAVIDVGEKSQARSSAAGAGISENTQDFRQEALNLQNEFRAVHGSPSMGLDELLCLDAELYATELAKAGELQHSKTTDGESLIKSCNMNNNEMNADEAIRKWYDEVCNPGYSFITDTPAGGTASFTQMIWKTTLLFGIGKATTREDGMLCTYIVGRYHQKGNTPGGFKTNVPRGAFDFGYCESLGKPHRRTVVPSSSSVTKGVKRDEINEEKHIRNHKKKKHHSKGRHFKNKIKKRKHQLKTKVHLFEKSKNVNNGVKKHVIPMLNIEVDNNLDDTKDDMLLDENDLTSLDTSSSTTVKHEDIPLLTKDDDILQNKQSGDNLMTLDSNDTQILANHDILPNSTSNATNYISQNSTQLEARNNTNLKMLDIKDVKERSLFTILDINPLNLQNSTEINSQNNTVDKNSSISSLQNNSETLAQHNSGFDLMMTQSINNSTFLNDNTSRLNNNTSLNETVSQALTDQTLNLMHLQNDNADTAQFGENIMADINKNIENTASDLMTTSSLMEREKNIQKRQITFDGSTTQAKVRRRSFLNKIKEKFQQWTLKRQLALKNKKKKG